MISESTSTTNLNLYKKQKSFSIGEQDIQKVLKVIQSAETLAYDKRRIDAIIEQYKITYLKYNNLLLVTHIFYLSVIFHLLVVLFNTYSK